MKVAYPDNKAALVKVDDGQFTMKDGAVLKNNGGCGVYITGSGTFTMPGGEITGNNSGHSDLGDGWFPESTGGGVYVSSGRLKLGGTAEISGNTSSDNAPDNVYLEYNSFITLGLGNDEPVPGKMNVGVQTVTPSGIIVNSGANASHAQSFFADEPGNTVIFDNYQLVIIP